jgi:ABC-2 type transport system permease protein
MSEEHLGKWDRERRRSSSTATSNSTFNSAIVRTLAKTANVCELELRKIRRDYTDLLIRAIQPVLWLTIFGTAFSHVSQSSIPSFVNAVGGSPNGISYLAYITPGILAQSVLFISIFTGISMIWERDLGQLDRLLCSPVPRTAIVLGKSFTGGIRGLVQAAIIFVIAVVMEININFNPLYLAGVAAIVFTFGIGFSSLSIAISTMIKSRERIFGLVQLLTMPLFFASNALYPIQLMPHWLQIISLINPMSYAVDALRILMITGNFGRLLNDIEGLAISTMMFIILATIQKCNILNYGKLA